MTRLVDRLLLGLLVFCMLATAVLFAGQIVIVLLRYVMGIGFLELQDLVTYAFSVVVVLSVPLALWKRRHVRVDILRSLLTPRTGLILDRLGALILIVPVFSLMLWTGWPLVASSFAIMEGSRETGGLGGLFLVKGTMIVMCVLLIALGVLIALRKGGLDGD